MEFSRQEYWGGSPFPPPEDLPDPGTEPTSSALASGSFTTEPTGKPRVLGRYPLNHVRNLKILMMRSHFSLKNPTDYKSGRKGSFGKRLAMKRSEFKVQI